MIWAELIHLGMNFWGDIKRTKCPFPWMESPEAADAVREQYCVADHLRFDEDFWKQEVCPGLIAGGINTLVIDLGEGVVYPSHPELAVNGSWSAEKLKAEVRRLKALGLEVFPKLNFSSSHDAWLKHYQRMLSTPQYYQVCKDVIRDAIEIFDHPRFVHLGLDEETAAFQTFDTFACARQGDLWWHDVLMLIGEVEKSGARAWVWSDYIRRHPLDEFVKRMPKSVVQNPWTYTYTHFQEAQGSIDPSEAKALEVMLQLVDAGYDVIPCGSNCYGYKSNLEDLVRLFRHHPKRANIKGFFFAPWLKTERVFARRFKENGEQVANAICLWNGTDHKMPWRGVCARGGDVRRFPENMVAALVSAAQKGAAMVSFEARRCKAGELGEALDRLPKDGLWIDICCEGDVVAEVAAQVSERGRLHQVFVTAPLKDIVVAREKVPGLMGCSTSYPTCEGMWTKEAFDRYVAESLEGNCLFAKQPAGLTRLTPKQVAKFHGWRGSVIGSVCNDPARADELFASGVDFIVTDRLDDFLALSVCHGRF